MWWIISLIALVLLFLGAVVVTFLLMVALNGFPSLPDAFVYVYLVFICVLLPALSLLAGYLAKKYSDRNPNMPLWVAGLLATVASLAVLPILLCGLTFGVLVAFGMV